MSLPLSYFLTADRCKGVRFHCNECALHWDVPTETVIADLVKRGAGGPDTPLHDVAALARKPCLRCGSWRFISRPAW